LQNSQKKRRHLWLQRCFPRGIPEALTANGDLHDAAQDGGRLRVIKNADLGRGLGQRGELHVDLSYLL
jgi:hypothetical protein